MAEAGDLTPTGRRWKREDYYPDSPPDTAIHYAHQLNREDLLATLDTPPEVRVESGATDSFVRLLPQIRQLRLRLAQKYRLDQANVEPKLLAMGNVLVEHGLRRILISGFTLPPVTEDDYSLQGASVAFTANGARKVNEWMVQQEDMVVYDGHIHPDWFRGDNGTATFSRGDINSIQSNYWAPAQEATEQGLGELRNYARLGFLVVNPDAGPNGDVELCFANGAKDGLWTRTAKVNTQETKPTIAFRQENWEKRIY